MNNNTNDTKDRELIMSRILNAPVSLVWEVWSHPEHIAVWWGPEGFTNTIHEMDFRQGGKWDFIMHGPDGIDYPNTCTFTEIVPLKKIVYEHVSFPPILATIDFEDLGDKTRINWHMVFETAEIFREVAMKHKADIGLKQNLDRLASYAEKHNNQ